MATRRIHHEPAFILHRYDWSESSLILEVFTRRHGRVALAAKGVKRPTSSFRPVLLALQPLLLDFAGEGDVRTLKGAEWAGGHVMPTGEALLSGCYLNELLMRLLARDDPHPGLFDHYARSVQLLADGAELLRGPVLRAFELLLLRELGHLPELRLQTMNQQPLAADEAYALQPEAGLQALRATEGERLPALPGSAFVGLAQALEATEPLRALLALLVAWPAEQRSALQTQLRQLLHHHCGVPMLRTRQLMVDLQQLHATAQRGPSGASA